MEKFILRNIDFNKCSSYVMLSGFVWIVSVAMVPVKSIPQKPFQTAFHFIELCLSLYIYLGFVKFSILQKKDSFQKLIFVAMVFSIIQVLISMAATLMENKNLYSYNGVAVAIEAALIFYAFKSVQNVKTIDFRKLSRLYLYLLFFYVPASVSLLFEKESLKNIPQVLIKPFIILALVWVVLIVYTWYMKIRLFKQISRQMY
jgi:hypothetical protein